MGYSAYPGLVIAASPTVFLQLQEATGISAAESISADNGTYTPNSGGAWTGGTLNVAEPFSYINGPLFDGATGLVSVPDTAALGASGPVTCEALVYLTATQNNFAQVADKESGSSGFSFIVHSDGTVQFYVGDGSGFTGVISSSTLSLNQWHHIAGTANGTDLRVYIDGALACTPVSASTPAATSGTPLYIGANTAGATRFFTGLIADVAVYRGASILTATQILAHYNSAKAPPTGGGSTVIVIED